MTAPTKKLTKKEKLRILRAMRKIIESDARYSRMASLCWAFSKVTKMGSSGRGLADIGLRPPRKRFGHGWSGWWWYWFDYTSRLNAIDRAIKKLK